MTGHDNAFASLIEVNRALAKIEVSQYIPCVCNRYLVLIQYVIVKEVKFNRNISHRQLTYSERMVIMPASCVGV